MKNKSSLYLSIDFESWMFGQNSPHLNLDQEGRKKLDSDYIPRSTDKLLYLLAKNDITTTFFILGELHQWYPDVIEGIKQAGHEIAYHSSQHQKLNTVKDLELSLSADSEFIEKYHPAGFRAPQIFFREEYYKILSKNGFKYSSSIYGDFNDLSFCGVREFPVSVLCSRMHSKNLFWPRDLNRRVLLDEGELPFGSGYFIPVLGRHFTIKFIKYCLKMDVPPVLFLHNWQIFTPEMKNFKAKMLLKNGPFYLPYIRNCLNIFNHLISNFDIKPMNKLLDNYGSKRILG